MHFLKFLIIGDYDPHSRKQFSFYVLFYIHRWWEKTKSFLLTTNFWTVVYVEILL